MADCTQHTRTRVKATASTPQTAPIPGRERAMRPNDAGVYTFILDPWKQLERFLILGSEGGTYYVSERELTVRNAEMLKALIALDGTRVVTTIRDISHARRAPKQSPALFALAACAKLGDDATRSAAYAAAQTVCGTLSTLKEFVRNTQAFGGWSAGLRRCVAHWLEARPPRALAFQFAKYQSRAGWSNVDLLRCAHFKPANASIQNITNWVFSSTMDAETLGFSHGAREALAAAGDEASLFIEGFNALRAAPTEAQVVGIIQRHRLTHEMVPNELKTPAVWEALLTEMPMWAMLRNLSTLARNGLLTQLSDTTRLVTDRLRDRERLKNAKMHPAQFLMALKGYGSCPVVRNDGKTWTVIPQVLDALDDAFYGSFAFVEPTGKSIVVALDVSGSMMAACGESNLTCHEASAVMAMATIRTETNWGVIAFDCKSGGWSLRRGEPWTKGDRGVYEPTLSPTMKLADVVKTISKYGGGGTDCSLPFQWARVNKLKVDAFITCTDNETWAGTSHPAQALAQYRADSGIDARSATLAFTATAGALGEQDDPRLLEAVGFDATVPTVVADFIRSGGF